jgi:hypothetical protein
MKYIWKIACICVYPAEDGASFLFGQRSAVVTGLLAAIDSLFCFCLFGLIGYTCFEFSFVCGLFKGTRPAGFCAGLFSVHGVGLFVDSIFPDSLVLFVWTGYFMRPCVWHVLFHCLWNKDPRSELPALCAWLLHPLLLEAVTICFYSC